MCDMSAVTRRYAKIPIVDTARRCGIYFNERTLGRTEVEAKCPFCGDKPRGYHLFLNTQRDVFKCHLCGEGGNSVSLYARLQSPPISNGEAARELLAGDNLYPVPQLPQPKAPPEREPKPIAERHEVFTAMLNHLVLSPKHYNNLLERGLSPERIKRNMYRSLPESEEARRFLAQILSDFYELDGISGFFTNNRGEYTVSGSPGLLIPHRDMNCMIQGMQIRIDDGSNSKRKYRWFSSTGMKNGTKSGSWIHVTGNTDSKTAYITEGGLKGDIASFFDNDALFICFAGINAIGGLKECVKELGITEAVIAGDMDKVTNWRVRNGFNNIARELSKIRGLKVRFANWNACFKGVDDYYYIRHEARKRGLDMSVKSNDISKYLHELWQKEYPEQDRGFIYACEWEEKIVPLSELRIDPPEGHMNVKKARYYLEQIQAGIVFPPAICINGFVIDGFHRCWAYAQAGVENVQIYQNVAWSLEASA